MRQQENNVNSEIYVPGNLRFWHILPGVILVPN